MATITLDTVHLGTGGYFEKAWSRFEEARRKDARKRVHNYLQTLSDDQLKALSFSREEISDLKVD